MPPGAPLIWDMMLVSAGTPAPSSACPGCKLPTAIADTVRRELIEDAIFEKLQHLLTGGRLN